MPLHRLRYHVAFVVAVVVFCMLVVVPAGKILFSADEAPAPKLPPLVIRPDAPLLSDEGAAKPGDELRFLRINRVCYVCHENYRDEPLAVVHAKQSVSCMDCHGPSLKHRDDEDHLTPPDIMFPASQIDHACAECHETHDAPARAVLARWRERCPEKTDFATVTCTDCHGFHRLERRTVRWDKGTGKLLKDVPAESGSFQAESVPSGTSGAGR